MRSSRGFDEVMIVNPIGCNANTGARLMRFHPRRHPPHGPFGEPPNAYGQYGESPEVGYYAEAPGGYGYGYYGEPEELAWYGEPADPYGYYAPPAARYGCYGQPPDLAEAEPVGYLADESPYAGYGQVPEMVGYGDGYGNGYGDGYGYGEPPPLEPYPGVGWYGQPTELTGYVRDVPPPFNAGCPMPSNVAGYDG